jgi:hypothetical protein
MITETKKLALLALASLVAPMCASAHVNYDGHDFGTFASGTPRAFAISDAFVQTNAGWADGTDGDFANAHHVTFFRFTLADPTLIAITVSASDNGGAFLGGLLPGFSIYSGLAHLPPAGPDYDTNPATRAYLISLGGTQPKEGAFRAMNTWKMGNIEAQTEANLSTFTYMAHAVDGTSANYGLEAGINGDGFANGTVTGTFSLPAGDYSLVVAGADLPNETAVGNYGMVVSVASVPEPATTMTLSMGFAAVCAIRRRR